MERLKVLIPKGRLFDNVFRLFSEAGFELRLNKESVHLKEANGDLEIKLLKAQNIPKLVEIGAHDVGFSGFDWVTETGARVEELLDLKFDPVNIVSAVSQLNHRWKSRDRLLVASEYENITRRYLTTCLKKKFDFIRSYGATEVYPPDDADLIVDNMATGRTLQEHNLRVLDVILPSSTRMFASFAALKNRTKRKRLEELATIFQAVLNGKERVILEMNVPESSLAAVVGVLPAMRSPTIASLYGGQGFSVKVAVPRRSVKGLIPLLRRLGAGDILELEIRKVII